MEFDYEEYLDEYFDPMELTDEEKENRKEIAKEIRDAILFWFSLLMLYYRYAIVDRDSLKTSLRSRLAQVVYNHSTADAYTVQYLDTLTNSVFDTTMKDIDKQTQDAYADGAYELDRTYALSDERATFIGANEADSIGNREEWLKAIEEGKTHKTWKAFIDKRTRKDHEKMDGKRIPIKEYFKFPDCKGLYPHDEVHLSAKQCVNCRCVAVYDADGEYENEESRKAEKALNADTRVDKSLLNTDALRERLRALGEDIATTREIVNCVDEILKHRDGTNFEDLAYVNSSNQKTGINKSYDYYDPVTKTSACKPNNPMNVLLKDSDEYTIIGIHNHPNSNTPSLNDLEVAQERKYKYGITVAHDGTIYKYNVQNADISDGISKVVVENSLAKMQTSIYNDDTEKFLQSIEELNDKGILIEVFR